MEQDSCAHYRSPHTLITCLFEKITPANSMYNNVQQAYDIHPMLVECWASVADGGPTLKKDWGNIWCMHDGWPGIGEAVLTSAFQRK